MGMGGVMLVGLSEIRVRFGGISRQRVDQLVRRSSFPKPVATLAQGRVWLAAEVDEWAKIHRPERS